MKITCAVALVALASAAAPPRIALNLAEITEHTDGVATITKLPATKHYTHDLGYTQPTGADVASSQDWTMRCPVSDTTTALNCPPPDASAYDHHNKAVTVQTRIFLVDWNNAQTKDGVALPVECKAGSSVCTGVDYTTRSMYLFKYDAQDASGNHAEQIVFGLIVDDTAAPQITWDVYKCHETAGGCKPATCLGSNAACVANINDQEMCEHLNRTRNDFGCEWGQATAGRRCYNDFQTQGWIEAASTWRFCPAGAFDVVDGDRVVKYAIYKGSTAVVSKATALPYADIKDKIDTLEEGTFTIYAMAEDDAEGFGVGGENNKAETSKTITITDTRKPWITVVGTGIVDEKTEWDTATYPCNPLTHKWGCEVLGYPLECGMAYQKTCTADELANMDSMGIGGCDEGALVNDKFDDANGVALTSTSTLTDYPIDVYSTTDQYINYTGTDSKGLAATLRQRVVSVRDTTTPTIQLTPCAEGICQHEAGTAAWVDPGASCVDSCDSSPKMVDATDPDLAGYPSWSPAFDSNTPGNYTRTYKCKDASGLVQTATRLVQVADNNAPTITLQGCETAHPDLGAPHCQVEATLSGVYTDPTSSCSDSNDGPITMSPPTGTVNINVPGSYDITYTCTDAADNTATVTRTVLVSDTTAPTMELKGSTTEYVEAGFPYADPMLSCTSGCAYDNIDLDISDKITATGNTVNTIDAFAKYRTCKEIKTAFETEAPGSTKPDGWYTISLVAPDADGNDEVQLHKVWCDLVAGVTYFPSDRIQDGPAAAVVPYDAAHGSCSLKGLKMAQWATTAAGIATKAKVKQEFGDEFFVEGSMATSTHYMCSFNELTETTLPSHTVPDQSIGDIRHAVPGTYTITYRVQDNATPPNSATPLTRTVIVQDTLPPVIVMSLPGTSAQHISDHSATGLNSVANPAGDADHNPFIAPFDKIGKTETISLMAEATQASVNGWFIAAIASAVTGVALLTMRRDTAVHTSVPV